MKQRDPSVLYPSVHATALILVLSACGFVDEPPMEAVCIGEPRCSVTFGGYIDEENPLGPGETLFVRGMCSHDERIAIRQVSFAGQIMDNPTHNYEHWEASLEYAFITTYDEGGGVAMLPFFAVDACGEEKIFDDVAVWLAVTNGD